MAKNTPKNTAKQKAEPEVAAAAKKKNNASSSGTSSFKNFMSDPRVKKIAGIFIAAFGVYLFLACLSYLISGGHDQYLITGDTTVSDFSEHEPFRNWMGKIGAHLAHFFMFTYLGIGAFFVAFVLFLWGVRVAFNREPLPFYKSIRLSVLGVLYFPLLIGFLFHNRVDEFERTIEITCNDRFVGGYGHFATEWTTFTLGWFGTLMLLLLVAGAYFIFNHNHMVDSLWARIKEWWANRKAEKAAKAEALAADIAELDEADEEEEADENESEAEKKTIIQPLGNSLREDKSFPEMIDLHSEDEEEGPEPYLTTKPSQPEPAPSTAVEVAPEPVQKNTNIQFHFDNEPEEVSSPPISPNPTSDAVSHEEPAPVQPSPEAELAVDGLEVEAPQEESLLTDEDLENKVQEFGEYDPKLDLSRYELPSIELLKPHGSGVPHINKEELEANKNKIVETLNHYKIEIDKIKATIGPTVTLYEIVPAPGVRISKIKNLEDDIALSLAALGIRIIAPIPGKGTIGIEVPNSRADVVSMRSLIMSEKFQHTDMDLPVVLGKTISNETFVADLAKMPHLLMAGATGQGKSVGLNAILVSLLYKKHPSQIKFVLVDPKKVELTLFNKIERHFLAKLPDSDEPIITDTSKVVRTLNSLCIEMDERYELLKIAQCRNIKEYNAKFIARRLNPENGHRYLPYIVLVVDEFADLIMTAGREVETPIARLAQLARAIGIHLIIATQRPSVNIITGTIKANFPARIAFRVTSKIDSRTILDAGGADQLIGRGDMLYSTGNDLIRIQCGFVDTPEVEEITDFIGSQQGYPHALHLPEVPDESSGESLSFDDEDRDALFEDAARIVVMTQQGSASMLQRKLKLGYNRAGRLVDQLEAAGIIGPFEGSKARKVLIPDEISLDAFLKNLNNP